MSGPRGFVGRHNVEQWIRADLEGCGFTEAQAKSLRMRAVGELASDKPERAITLMDELNLDSDDRRIIITNLFAGLRGNPRKAEAALALLSSEEERKMALRAIPDAGNTPPKIEKSADWLTQVLAADLHSNDSGPYQYLPLLNTWDSAKIAALTDGFQALPSDQKRQVATVLAAGSGFDNIHALQGDAIHYLIANPEPDSAAQAPADPMVATRGILCQASQFAAKWVKKDATAASAWVQSLPEGEAKAWAQKNIAANWMQVDPDAAERWLATLPAADREQVQAFLKK